MMIRARFPLLLLPLLLSASPALADILIGAAAPYTVVLLGDIGQIEELVERARNRQHVGVGQAGFAQAVLGFAQRGGTDLQGQGAAHRRGRAAQALGDGGVDALRVDAAHGVVLALVLELVPDDDLERGGCHVEGLSAGVWTGRAWAHRQADSLRRGGQHAKRPCFHKAAKIVKKPGSPCA